MVERSEAESYYFVGKDNIPFHAVIWPAMLMGHGDLNLPTDVPANQYITFKGRKASKSKGVGRPIGWYAERLEPDALRYAIASVLPEQNDTDLSDDEIIRRVNEELVATWGNLVNRVLSMSARNFDGRSAPGGQLTDEDEGPTRPGPESLEQVGGPHRKGGAQGRAPGAMDAARRGQRLSQRHGALEGGEGGSGASGHHPLGGDPGHCRHPGRPRTPISPTRPMTIGEMLGIGPAVGSWSAPEVLPGTELGDITPVFIKLDGDALED
jgi:methionyl-tRNA synthetase